jgi:hypothetical protein
MALFVPRPTLPTHNVDLTWDPPTGGTTYTCGSDPGDDYSDIATALAALVPGDILELRAETFNISSTIQLPALANAGNAWIYIRSMNWANLGTIDRRATASDTANMAKLQFTTTSARLETDFTPGGNKANYIRLMGLEITGTHNVKTSSQTGMVMLGRDAANDPSADADQPHHLIIDRCYIHGQSAGDYLGGIRISTKECAVLSSTITEIHDETIESHGIIALSGTGDLQVYNCHIEASGINIMIGGGIQQISDAQFDNTTIRRNYLTKPTAWKDSDDWEIKNCFETKFGRYILFEDNRATNSWDDQAGGGQDGPLISLKLANGGDSWTDCSHITIRNNWISNGNTGIKFKAKDNANACDNGLSDIVIENNVIDNVNTDFGEGGAWDGTLFDINPTDVAGLRLERLIIRHNTALHDGQGQTDRLGSNEVLFNSFSNNLDCWVYENNVVSHYAEGASNKIGIKRDGIGAGEPSIERACTTWRCTNNIWIHTSPGSYPSGNTLVANYAAMNFADYANSDTDVAGYELTASSPGYLGATGGRNCGAHCATIKQKTLHCVDGDWT